MKVRFDFYDKNGPLATREGNMMTFPAVGEDIEMDGKDYGTVKSVVWVMNSDEMMVVLTVRS